MNFTIPEGLSEMLRDFTVAVLRARPSNLYQFAADYFSKTATTNGKTTINVDYSPGGATNGPPKTTMTTVTVAAAAGVSNSVDHHPQQQQQQPGVGDVEDGPLDEGGRSGDGGAAKVVPMYIVVDDDDEAREPDKTELRPKTSRQHRYGRRHSVSAERYDPEADDDTDENKVTYAKNDSQRERLKDAVSGILIFRSLDIDQMSDVIDAMFERHVTPGETVIRQGDDGDNFYVIESGTYEVTVRSGPAHPEDATTGSSGGGTGNANGEGICRRVHTFDGKGSFGELALMYNMPRSATVIASSPGTLWAMDRRSFRRIVLRSAFRKRKMYEQLIEKVPLLQHLESYERMNVADALSSTSFETGQCIIREGAEADGMYFIEQGRVRVTITRDGVETDASTVEAGGYFGEMALVENAPRSASVYAADGEAVRVAFLERKCFERLLGPCLDIMRRNITTYKKSS